MRRFTHIGLTLAIVILAVSSTWPVEASLNGAASQAGVTPRRVFLPVVMSRNVTVGNPPPAPTATPIPLPTATATPIPTPTKIPTPFPTPSKGSALLVAAGDIAMCGRPGDTQTETIINGIPSATVLAMGDNAYDSGLATEYATCYDPTWGVFKNRTRPVPGNHDYLSGNADGYFGYFGSAAGNPSQGWYSFNLGSWHILAINSNCVQVGGCNTNSPQEAWVRSDLAAHPAACTLAFWHHPYYSSGANPNAVQMAAIWQDLYNAGAEIVLSGHDHDYERFAPQDASANLDSTRGIVQFVAGTGGSNFTALNTPREPNSITSQDTVFGVLELTLKSTSYTFQYISVDGSFSDSGSRSCH